MTVIDLKNFLYLGCVCFSFLAFVLLLKNSKTDNHPHSVILSFFFFVLGCSVFDNLSIAKKWIIYYPFGAKFLFAIGYLVYPLLYLYVKAILTNKVKYTIKVGLHFIPFVLVILNFLVFYRLSINQTNNFVLHEFYEFSKKKLFDSNFFLTGMHYFLKQVQALFYLFLIWRLLFKNYILKRTTSKTSSSIKHLVQERNWLLTSCSLMTVSYIIFLILVIVNRNHKMPDIYNESALVAYSFSIFALCFYLFFNPYILYGLTALNIKEKQNKLKINIAVWHEDTLKPILDEDKWINLEATILEKGYFKKQGISLERLASELNVTSKQLSYGIKIYKKMKFQDYMNSLRLTYIISEFQKGTMKKNTIEAIGASAGFGSRSTFFSVFKKQMNCSPLEYIKSLSNGNSLKT